MNMYSKKAQWFWAGLCGVLLVACGLFLSSCREETVPPPKGSPARTGPHLGRSVPDPTPQQVALDSLVASGWDREAAQTVVELNKDYFEILSDENPQELNRELGRLMRLGKLPGLMGLLKKYPETAGLLAGAADPALIAQTLRKDDQYTTVCSFYLRNAGSDADQLAKALTRHRDTMCHLADRGFPGAETLFLFPRTSPHVDEYDQWLRDVFETALNKSDDDLTATLQFLMVQGRAIRRILNDKTFREKFRADTWPKFERLVSRSQLTFDSAILDLNLFRFLAQPYAERLVQRWGLLPVELLYGPDRYPNRLHPQIIEAMLDGDNKTLQALSKFGREPLFVQLLEREGISAKTRAAAFSKLWESGVNYRGPLVLFSKLSDSALADEVGPPPDGPVTWIPLYYTVYEVPKKLLQGRNPTLTDVAVAVTDPVFLFMGPLGPDDVIKIVGKEGLEAAATKSAGSALKKSLLTDARTLAVKSLGKEAAEKLAEKELSPWLLKQMLSQVQTTLRSKLGKAVTVEITGPTRFFYKTSGVGSETFKKMTKLEARVFMRADRRVLIRLDRLVRRGILGRVLSETAGAALVVTALESETGQEAVRKGFARGGQVKDSVEAWQKNVSAWWLANASGQVAELAREADEKSGSHPGRD